MPAPQSPPEALNAIAKGSDFGPALLAKLMEQVPPELVAEKILQLLNAELVNARGESYPDNRAIEAGLKIILSYGIGTPVQRQLVISETRENTNQTLERLLASPASRRALQAVLDEEKKVAPVEVDE